MQILFIRFYGWISNINNQCKQPGKEGEGSIAVAWFRYPEPILLLTICGVL